MFELGRRAATAAASGAGLRAHLSEAMQLNIGPAASEIAEELRVDPAYLARILRKFGDSGLTEVRTDPADGRRRILSLTQKGEAALSVLQQEANRELGALVSGLDERDARDLSVSLRRTMALLGGDVRRRPDIVLRSPAIGDVGWVIERQSKLYAEEHGWNGEYEALVCDIGGAFLRNLVPGKESCWIAEAAGERVGAVFLVRRSNEQAQLRMLHVEPSARGSGVGRMLVDECVRFAREAGYTSMSLWTQSTLRSARRLYDRVGFSLVSSEASHQFGQEMESEVWAMDL